MKIVCTGSRYCSDVQTLLFESVPKRARCLLSCVQDVCLYGNKVRYGRGSYQSVRVRILSLVLLKPAYRYGTRVLLKPTYGTSTRGTAFSIARRVLATTNEKLGTRVAQHCALFHSPAWTNSIRCQREGHKSAPPHNQGGRNFWHLEIRARRIFLRTVFFRDCNFQ